MPRRASWTLALFVVAAAAVILYLGPAGIVVVALVLAAGLVSAAILQRSTRV